MLTSAPHYAQVMAGILADIDADRVLFTAACPVLSLSGMLKSDVSSTKVTVSKQQISEALGSSCPQGHSEHTTVLYEVCRVRSGGKVMYLAEHVSRFVVGMQKLHIAPVGGSGEGDGVPELFWDDMHSGICGLVDGHVALSHDPHVEQNVKFLAWLWSSSSKVLTSPPAAIDELAKGASGIRDASKGSDSIMMMQFACYFIKSHYPPPAWYDPSAAALSLSRQPLFTTGLLFGVSRPDPNVKQMGHSARSLAAARQQKLGLFETWIVQPDLLMPEGSRSNFLLVNQSGHVASSCNEDILIGVTFSVLRRMLVQKRDIAAVICSGTTIAALPSFVQKKLTVLDLVRSRAMVMTGTSVGVLPVTDVVMFANDEECEFLRTSLHLLLERENTNSDEASHRLNDRTEDGVHDELERLMKLIAVDSSGRGVLMLPSSTDPVVAQLRQLYESQAY